MLLRHRKAHRYIWSLLLPLLVLIVLLLSNSTLDTMPANASVPGLPSEGTSGVGNDLAHRELP